MPKTTKGGKPKEDELPSTLKRSSGKAQRTFTKAYDAAAEQYGSEERAHRVAYSALKHSFEKVGDRWERKKKRGPSDARAERGGLRITRSRRLRVSTRTPARGICSTSRAGLEFAEDRRWTKQNWSTRSRNTTGGSLTAEQLLKRCRPSTELQIRHSLTQSGLPPATAICAVCTRCPRRGAAGISTAEGGQVTL